MSATAEHPRYPLVLAATRPAVKQAERLGVTGCLEVLVERAIEAGRIGSGAVTRNRVAVRSGIAAGEPHGETKHVLVDGGFVVEIRRTRSPSGRRAWLPTYVARSRKRVLNTQPRRG